MKAGPRSRFSAMGSTAASTPAGTPAGPPACARSTAARCAAWTARATCAALAYSTAALADPMRPLQPPPLAAPGLAASAADLSAPAGTTSPTPATPSRTLQAIRSDSQGQHLALFGDRWLRVGDRFTATDGETSVQVLAIGPNQVDVQQGRLRHTYFLLPPLLPGQWLFNDKSLARQLATLG